MGRGPDAFTCLLDQFQGAFYRAIYVDKFSLTQFADAMTVVLDATQSISHIAIKLGESQWQSCRKRWDKEWDIKNGGPSLDVHHKLLDQRSWFFKDTKGRLAYKPFNLDAHALSMLPAGLGMAADSSNHSSQCEAPRHQPILSQALQPEFPGDPYTTPTGSHLRSMNHPTVSQSVCQPAWAPDPFESNVSMTDNNLFFNNPGSMVESTVMQLDQFSNFGMHSPNRSHDQSPIATAWNATQFNPSCLPAACFDDAGQDLYTTTIHSGQINGFPSQAVQAPGNTWPDTARPRRQSRMAGLPYADPLV